MPRPAELSGRCAGITILLHCVEKHQNKIYEFYIQVFKFVVL